MRVGAELGEVGGKRAALALLKRIDEREVAMVACSWFAVGGLRLVGSGGYQNASDPACRHRSARRLCSTWQAAVKKKIKAQKASGSSGQIQSDSRLTLFTSKGQMIRQFKCEALAVVFGPASQLLASGGHDKCVTIRHVGSGEEVARLAHASNVRAIAMWRMGGQGEGEAATFIASGGKTTDSGSHALRIRAVDSPEVVAFWLAPPMVEVGTLRAVLPPHALLFQTGPSGRCLVAHAAAMGEHAWLAALVKSNLPLIGAAMLQRDATGHHAMDYAVMSGEASTVELLLGALWSKVPPRGREELFHTPHEEIACCLLEIARQFPKALAKVLEDTPLDEYEDSANKANLIRKVGEEHLLVGEVAVEVA